MNYKRIYDSLITNARLRFTSTANTRKQWTKEYKKNHSDYIEIHHIIPTCLGGADQSANLCVLTAKEHYIAHKLLWKLNPTSSQLFYAYNMMSMYTKTSTEYDIIKTKCSQFNKGCNNPFFNRTHSVNSKRNMLKTMLDNNQITPIEFNQIQYLSINSASKLLSCNKRAILRHIARNEYGCKYIDYIDIDACMWQLSPTQEQITNHSIMYKSLIATTKSIEQQTKLNNAYVLLNRYIESDYNNLDTYAKSIGMSDCGLAYQFKRFPQYTIVSNGCKQFTKEKAIELLNSIAL
jgi:hypothetical protein